MGISIQVKNAEFTHVIASLSLPFRSGLVGEFILGGSAADSIKNRASPGLASMSEVGAPGYGEGYAEIMSGANYASVGFDTGIVTPDDATIILVVRKKTELPVFMSSDTLYNGFHNYGNAPLLYNGQSGDNTSVANVPVPTHTDFAFFAGLMPNGGFGVIHTYLDGELTTNTAEYAGSPNRRGTGTLKIGTTLKACGVGIADMAYAAIFDRVLSASEVGDAYASLKAFLAMRGVVVS